MTFELLEMVRLYVGATGRASKIAAQNCQLNGYKELALQHSNEAAMAEKIIRDLAPEHGEANAHQKADY